MSGPRQKSDRRGQRVTGLLDIGTSKVAAAILLTEMAPVQKADVPPRILGLGMQRSRGVKAGVLTDLDEAETAVRGAIAQAERAAGVELDNVIVSVASGRLKSHHFSASVDVQGGTVQDEDIDRVMQAGRVYAERDGRSLVHFNRFGFRLDGVGGVADPRGLAASQLSAGLHAVTADEAPLRNLLLLIERCYLKCSGLVAAPYASALAVTTAEERELGVTCIELGAGTSTIAIFAEGRFAGVEVVPVGSQHITFDIAKALQTPLAEAERIKTLYGTLVSAQSDEHETLTYPLAGEDDGATHQTTKARLTDIIRPRVAHIFSLLGERLAENEVSQYSGDRIVLTGGASQLLGMSEFAANELARPVRTGKPVAVAGMPPSVSGPHFATLAGLALAAHEGEEFTIGGLDAQSRQGYLGRVGSWLRASF